MRRILIVGCVLSACVMGPVERSHAQERCKGIKKWHAGQCRYPDEIERMKEQATPKPRPLPTATHKKPEPEPPPPSPDDVACQAARAAGTRAAWQDYLDKLPGGACGDEARRATRPEPPPAPPPTSEPSADRGPGAITYIGVGAAAAGLVTWGVAGAIALTQSAALREDCPDDRCPYGSQGRIDEATTAAHLSTLGFGVMVAGVGLLGYGLIAWKISQAPADEGARVELTIAPGSLGAVGRF